MSSTRSIRARRLKAATVPTRWPVPRPDAGRPSAAAGGSGGFAIGCSCRVDLLCRPAELIAVAQHAMEDDRELAGHGDGGLPGADPLRQTPPLIDWTTNTLPVPSSRSLSASARNTSRAPIRALYFSSCAMSSDTL